MMQVLFRHKTIIFIILGVIILAILPFMLPSFWTQMLTQVIIMALFATALNIEVGYAGMMPLAQAMFLGVGSYTFCIFIIHLGLPLGIAVIASLVSCVIINAIIGYLCLRGKPITFGLLHMAFGILIGTIVAKWIPVTGGDAGLAGLTRPGIFNDNYYFYLFALVVIIICYIIIHFIMHSPFGRIAQGLRENEERLVFLGLNTKRYQLTIFIIAGFFAGVAGILLALLNRGAFPSYVALILSAQATMMCLIGGAFNFWGPSLGSALVIIFSNLSSNYVFYWQGILGVLMVGTVLGFRGGILRKGKSTHKVNLNLKPDSTIDKTSPEVKV
jgi:branched-chain amino acid transport system permease protein